LARVVKATVVNSAGTREVVYPTTNSSGVVDFESAVKEIINSLGGISSFNVAYDPAHTYARRYIMTASGTTLTIPAGMRVLIGDEYYFSSSDTVININNSITVANRAGKDVYLYATTGNNHSINFVVSLNSTVPSGYTANNSRKIGGFHCICASVGTIAGHELSGAVTGDILPASVWDLNFRPNAEPEGMVFDEYENIWVDIYLASYNGSNLVSEYGGVIADGASNPKFHWYKFVDYFRRVKKRLPWQHEFMSFSLGSNQSTNIAGSADPGRTGGHSDTAGRRMISHLGCEDCCGVMWQWGLDTGSNSSSAWSDAYDSNDDGDSLGQGCSKTTRCELGSSWANGAVCGSRGSSFGAHPLYMHAGDGARGVCTTKASGAE
jgi:hypothetical protein